MKNPAWILCLLSLGATGCGAPWKIVKQTEPNPLLDQKEFSIVAVDYSLMKAAGGMSSYPRLEADFVKGLKDDEKTDFEDNKKTLSAEFANSLASNASGLAFKADANFLIKPIVTLMDGGVQAFIVTRESRVEMRVQIVAKDGNVIDEITIKSTTNPNLKERARSWARISHDGSQLGWLAARYLVERTTPPPPK
jgi:hypothetical protein